MKIPTVSPSSLDGEINLAICLKSKRPGCVLIQAGMGCGENNSFLQSMFDPSDWLTAPTPEMVVIRAPKSDFAKLAKLLKARKNNQ